VGKSLLLCISGSEVSFFDRVGFCKRLGELASERSDISC